MSIKTLLDFIGQQNIADKVDEETLTALGERIRRDFDQDHESMKDWIEGVEEGFDLMKTEFNTKSTPWDGASNYKDPMLAQASVAFGDKASLELLRSRNLVKADIIGKDPAGEKKELADRITEAMNHQVNYQMKEWRPDQKRLLYTLPSVGAMFKKMVFNALEGKVESHTIQYPDFAVNQATTSMNKARSFTQIHAFDKNEVIERQRGGLWLEDIDIYSEDSDGDEGSNEAEETLTASENPERFLEQQCFCDLDDDGYQEPYVVTIHEQTQTIVRIVARYDEQSLMVRTPQGRILNLVKAIKEQQFQLVSQGGELPEQADLKDFELIRIEPLQQIVKYGFIPAEDGTFLDKGYSHLLGAIVQAVNTNTNQITDAGTLRNTGGGLLAKGFRKKMGPAKLKIGQYLSTDIPAKDLHSGILPNPSPEPSVVLLEMLKRLEAKGNAFSAVVDASGQIQANTAPTTALAIINESLISTSALLGRIIDSESQEFQILFRLNQRTFDPELYQMILDDPQADAQSDFNNESLDIVPTASAEMSSKFQRVQMAVVELEQIPNVIQSGSNPMPIVKNFFEQIGTTYIDAIFPEQPTDQQAEEMARFANAQEQANQIQLAQLEFQKLQTEVLMREQDRLDADTQRKIEETIAKIKETGANTLLKLEQAESEEVKNQISIYTTEMTTITDMLTSIGEVNARRDDLRPQVPTQ